MPTTLTAAKPGDNATSAKDERTRCSEINAIGQRFDVPPEMVQRALGDGTDVDTFRRQTLEEMGQRSETTTFTSPAVTANGQPNSPAYLRAGEQTYSLTRAINAHLTRDWSEAGFEREVGQEVRNHMGRSAQGIFVPEVALAQRALLTSSNAASLIGTQQAGNMFIEALTPETHVMNLGATVMPGLREDVSIPYMKVGTEAQWIAEDSEAAESTPLFASVTLSMRQLSAHSRMSRRQLKQSVPALDDILRNDLRRQIAVAVDRAAIAGAGGALEPEGILNVSGIGSVSLGNDGDSLSWPKIAALMAELDGANLGVQSMGFLTNAKVKAALMSIPTVAHGHTAALESSDGKFRLGGAPALFSNNVPNDLTKGTGTNLSAMIYGAWSELIIGMWGGVDIITDEVTEATKGNVRIVAHSEWDMAVRHPEAFAAITDIVTD